MRLPNQAIKRERHITPTIDDMLIDLNGAKIFSKLDLNAGYHQLELDKDSRNITTFSSHVGLRRYKRLSFGISSAAEIFQNTLSTALEGLDGVKNISDDIIVFGGNQDEHDTRLEAAFQRIQEKNLTLNKGKCEFNKRQIEFFGYIFGDEGISADPRKIDAIRNAEVPANASEVRSFLGMTNYVGRFIPNYSTITAPLRKLTRGNEPFIWGDNEQKAFEKLKNDLMSDKVMAYFDPKKETTMVVDASPVGLGALLTQEGKIIAYASRSLTDVESRYSQTEREALALVWGCKHFHLYLFGHTFKLISDHKPLEMIFNNPKSKPPARIERWRLKLQQYSFEVKYKPGKTNAADYMSRHPQIRTVNISRESENAEKYVNYIAYNSIPKAMTMKELCAATEADATLQKVIKSVKSGKWTDCKGDKTLEILERRKYDLAIVDTEQGTVVLCQNRIVVPKSLQKKVLQIAHEGHQGIVKTKQLLREKVWFPNIDKQVEQYVKACIACNANVDRNVPEPLQMSQLPIQPWTEVSMDFCGPFPSGDYLMIVIDDYSRYPIAETLTTISAKAVIPKLDNIFAMFGTPEIVKTDNGPPFNGSEFAKFAEYIGFKHKKVTPLWPQANGEAERFMKTIEKSLRAAVIEGRSWKQELHNFMRNYRATPHSTTNIPPSELMFGRNIRTKLPEIQFENDDAYVQERDAMQKRKMKMNADKKRKARKSEFKIGDTVLVKQERKNKMSTPFNPKPLTIVDIKGTMITASREGTKITRNASHYKLLPKTQEYSYSDCQSDSDDERDENEKQNNRPVRVRKFPKHLQDFVH